MDNNFENQESKVNALDNYYYTEPKDEVKEVNEPVLEKPEKPKTLLFAVLSLVFGILSVVCCCVTYLSLIFSVASIVFSIVSKKQLGYFNGLAIAGLILGIFGAVFGISMIVIEIAFKEYLDELIKQIEQQNQLPGVNNGF